MSDASVVLNAKAYCKIILHAAKYPYCAVNGILLAKTTSLKTKEIEFVDTIPLFHIALNLTPMAEIALMQIDEIVGSKGLTIAGYYSASDNLIDSTFEKGYNKIIDKIAANSATNYVFTVNSKQLAINLDNIALKMAQYSDGNFKPCDLQKLSLDPDVALDVCSQLLEEKAYNDLVDFDNHLDNVELDWKNPNINNIIENLI